MKRVVAVFVLAAIAGMPGCLGAPDLAAVRNDIFRQIPGASCDKEIELTLGPVALALARVITAVVPDARDAGRYLSDLTRVEVGVYNVSEVSAGNVSMPERLKNLQEDGDWELAVRARDDRQFVWVFYRADESRVKEIYIVALDAEELVMVRAKGRLERLVGYALSECKEI
ncbi:MAG: DUF4252 domain-containing protein [Chitinivibrionia bacterium]|nr:DUF4252 domain-containing protein [Chitinivibrionia bacterium]